VKKKNPWVAAILNLLLPGIGFAYLGTPSLIISGILLFVSGAAIEMIYVRYTVGMASRPSYWVWSVVAALSLVVITFVLTNIHNKSIETKEPKP
jgi:pilus assembly protein TadC